MQTYVFLDTMGGGGGGGQWGEETGRKKIQN